MIHTSKIIMTPDIQEFLHAMHNKHPVEAEKQSMRNGTSGYIPFTSTERPVRKLLHRMTAAISAMLCHENWGFTGLWSTRLPKGGYHVAHNHPKGWMSGICYIDVPTNESGHLVFEERTIKPETGEVVVFPSDLIHAVSPYEGDNPRLTVAFDLLRMEPRRAP